MVTPMSSKKTRKLRVYLRQHTEYYLFCWAEFLKDKSFSFGINSGIIFDEYGSAVYRGGHFTDHVQTTVTRGDISMKDAKDHHVSFHPPRIKQQSGIVHIVAANGKVDEWPLDWFPISRAQCLLLFTVADLRCLGQVTKPKRPYRVVWIPSGICSLRMELHIHPRQTSVSGLHDPKALGNIHGFSPDYIASFKFYQDDSYTTCMYIASDAYV
jgi:hypothetical protein